MEVKLGAHVYCIVSMMTTTTNSLRHYSLKLLLLTVAHTEVKLSVHVYYISMTTTCFYEDYIHNYCTRRIQGKGY